MPLLFPSAAVATNSMPRIRSARTSCLLRSSFGRFDVGFAVSFLLKVLDTFVSDSEAFPLTLFKTVADTFVFSAVNLVE